MTYMNVFFTAQKEKVVLDVCALDNTLVLLQQGCDITGGEYFKVSQIEGLLQYLLWIFLPDPSMRSKLALPPQVKVDYRAACFCHRSLIDIGFVCSVCLSIFCKFSPICTTCSTVFKVQIKPKRLKKLKTWNLSVSINFCAAFNSYSAFWLNTASLFTNFQLKVFSMIQSLQTFITK